MFYYNNSQKGVKVLSLFDGISCGYIALNRAEIKIDRYVAFEVDATAIRVSKNNFPEIEHMGNVSEADFTEFKNFDIVIGGSPCSWWSNARQNRKDIERKPDGMGYDLFCEFVRAVRETNCKYFLYENNYSIAQEIKEQISADLGTDFVTINSALLSAQNRKRCYWSNFPIKQPTDQKIMLSDVIPGARNGAAQRNQKTKQGLLPFLNIRKDGKSNCLIAYMANKNCRVELADGTTRPLSAEEFEILQTLPVGYTDCLAESKRKSVIALGWTVDVIAHIFNELKVNFENEGGMQL